MGFLGVFVIILVFASWVPLRRSTNVFNKNTENVQIFKLEIFIFTAELENAVYNIGIFL